jgi:putative flippase GtrA
MDNNIKETRPNIFVRFGRWCKSIWGNFKKKHLGFAQFIVFFLLSNGVTILQMILMPVFRAIFEPTSLLNINFQVFKVGQNVDGSPYYIFNYAAGAIKEDGTGGGLAYFIAIQITLAIAQVINFFAQRNITFKHTGNPWYAAMWYLIAYIAITFIAGAAQGLYKAPIYSLLIGWWGGTGESVADVLTMIIYAAISFWVFFPIFKIIFKNKKEKKDEVSQAENT